MISFLLSGQNRIQSRAFIGQSKPVVRIVRRGGSSATTYDRSTRTESESMKDHFDEIILQVALTYLFGAYVWLYIARDMAALAAAVGPTVLLLGWILYRRNKDDSR